MRFKFNSASPQGWRLHRICSHRLAEGSSRISPHRRPQQAAETASCLWALASPPSKEPAEQSRQNVTATMSPDGLNPIVMASRSVPKHSPTSCVVCSWPQLWLCLLVGVHTSSRPPVYQPQGPSHSGPHLTLYLPQDGVRAVSLTCKALNIQLTLVCHYFLTTTCPEPLTLPPEHTLKLSSNNQERMI